MKTGIFIGRFQPFHDGHKKCIEKILEDCDKCIIFARDTERSEKNPFDFAKCKAMIRAQFPDESRVSILRVDDLGSKLSVYIGRDVGYELIRLDRKTESISATDLRKKLYLEAGVSYKENPHPLETTSPPQPPSSAQRPHPPDPLLLRAGEGGDVFLSNNSPLSTAVERGAGGVRSRFPVIWLTGNTGSGKSTLAFAIRDHFNEIADAASPIARRVIVLDGDEMRATVSVEEGLSPEDRRKHNLRVARLAGLLSRHGFLVLVSVIAPFAKVRKEIEQICDPKWIYVKKSGIASADKPYEPPENPDLILDNNTISMAEGTTRLISYLNVASCLEQGAVPPLKKFRHASRATSVEKRTV